MKAGIQEDGLAYRLRLAGAHLLIAGLTGSGKSGLLWSIIAALAPDIAVDRVRICMIDLKFGSEMGAGDRLFHSFAWEVLQAVETLEMMVQVMTTRADPRRENARRTAKPVRDFVPTPGDPHWVLVIDEILDLLKISGELKLKRPIKQLDGTVKVEEMTVAKYVSRLLLSLLSRARSFGITVIAATQNAAKEIFELLRDMFTARVGLRVASPEQTAMIFGPGAADRGIDAVNIPVDEPGTIFVDSPEAGGQAIRARAFRVEDDDITWLVEQFGRPEPAVALPVLDGAVSVMSRPALALVSDDGFTEAITEAITEAEDDEVSVEQLVKDKAEVRRCRFCRAPLPPHVRGRRAEFCPGTNHKSKYHNAKNQLGIEG